MEAFVICNNQPIYKSIEALSAYVVPSPMPFWVRRYAGAGSPLVLPTDPVNATANEDASLWAAWMSEHDLSLKPHGNCGREPVRGYAHFSNGFGFYQPDFMVRDDG